MQTIGKTIKYWRGKKGLSQSGLAEKAGLHKTTIGKIEADMRHGTNINTLQNIAQALGISIDRLMNSPNRGL